MYEVQVLDWGRCELHNLPIEVLNVTHDRWRVLDLDVMLEHILLNLNTLSDENANLFEFSDRIFN